MTFLQDCEISFINKRVKKTQSEKQERKAARRLALIFTTGLTHAMGQGAGVIILKLHNLPSAKTKPLTFKESKTSSRTHASYGAELWEG